MDEHLLGYLLNSLDAETHQRVEAHLRNNPQAQARLESLRRLLAPLEEDRDNFETPADLSTRTLAHVAEFCCRELPRSPRPNTRQLAPARPLWRRMDVLIAASVLLAVVTLSFPAIAHLRYRWAKIECQGNLKQFYSALAEYRSVHRELPKIENQGEHNVAGMIAPLLNDAGVLPKTASMRCPAAGPALGCNLTVQQIQALSPHEFEEKAPQLIPSYAYSLGYLDDAGGYQFPKVPAGLASSAVPLMADRPPLNILSGNSSNHGGYGQNVLFHDGSISFLTDRRVSGDADMYLNREGKVAAGVCPYDFVLGASEVHP